VQNKFGEYFSLIPKNWELQLPAKESIGDEIT
jgi:hypothetical protein